MIYPSAGFDANATLTAVEEERCTALYGVPTMFIAELMLPDFERFDLSSLRTDSVMLGYWDDPGRTAEAIDSEGWMHTGDMGTIDAEGYGNIVGRIKDMVIRGGENVYPREIEEFLFAHPKVAEAQVVGVPDVRLGEELCAWIRLVAGETCDEEEIRAYCLGRIAHYKIPRYVRLVDAFPMTASGKVQKSVIRDVMIRELNLTTSTTA